MAVSSIAFHDGASSAGQAVSGHAAFLLETIVCDVHWTALQIGALALLLSRARSGSNHSLQTGRHLIHDDSKTMLLALRYAGDIGLPADVVASVTKIYRDVGEAKVKLAPVLGSTRNGGAADRLVQGHSDAWRRLAGQTATMIALLHQATGSRLNAAYATDCSSLRKFLDQAARGTGEAIDASGAINMPKLTQRRQAPRLAVERSCALLLPTGPLRVKLQDVSRGGLGVLCDVALGDRQDVTVVFDDGRQIEAVVVRRQGSQIGLQLKTPLSAMDPLLNATRG